MTFLSEPVYSLIIMKSFFKHPVTQLILANIGIVSLVWVMFWWISSVIVISPEFRGIPIVVTIVAPIIGLICWIVPIERK